MNSNLAQFVNASGRFRSDAPVEPIIIPIAAAPARVIVGRTFRQRMVRGGPSERVLRALEKIQTPVSLPELITETGLVKDSCVSALRHLCDTDEVARSGRVRHYRYALK